MCISSIAPTPRARVNRVLAAEDTELVIKPHATEAAVINLLYRFVWFTKGLEVVFDSFWRTPVLYLAGM